LGSFILRGYRFADEITGLRGEDAVRGADAVSGADAGAIRSLFKSPAFAS